MLAELPDLLTDTMPARQYGIIADSTVANLFGGQIEEALREHAPTTVATFPAGERNKTRETWQALTDQLLESGLARDGAIVALGGGVTGDLAGFVAATYLRGVPYAQVPTTLLAMIDSSIGGKTGVDTAFGKNLVGAFHQPRLVVADASALGKLPRHQLVAGLAEALKHGYIADPALLDSIEAARELVFARDPATLIDLIERSIRVKVDIVSDDEREAGRRATLNFGHTVGHALEATTGYSLLHGEAVALGMIVETEIAAAIGASDRKTVEAVRRTVATCGLPTDFPEEAQPDRMLEAMQKDKKARDGAIHFALIQQPGEIVRGDRGEWTVAVPTSTIMAVLNSL